VLLPALVLCPLMPLLVSPGFKTVYVCHPLPSPLIDPRAVSGAGKWVEFDDDDTILRRRMTSPSFQEG